MRMQWTAVAGLLGTLVLGGCSDEPKNDDSDVMPALRDVVTGLENQDGPLVCAQLHRNAQVALAKARNASDCITAVSAGPFDSDLVTAAADFDGYEIEVTDGTAEADGPAADALAQLLGMQGVWLSMFEDTWMIQATADGGGGTAG